VRIGKPNGIGIQDRRSRERLRILSDRSASRENDCEQNPVSSNRHARDTQLILTPAAERRGF
jgi:hypothetical protein